MEILFAAGIGSVSHTAGQGLLYIRANEPVNPNWSDLLDLPSSVLVCYFDPAEGGKSFEVAPSCALDSACSGRPQANDNEAASEPGLPQTSSSDPCERHEAFGHQ